MIVSDSCQSGAWKKQQGTGVVGHISWGPNQGWIQTWGTCVGASYIYTGYSTDCCQTITWYDCVK